jgi:hypothetical protein
MQRLNSLKEELDNCVSSSKSCLPALAVIGVVVPLVVWAVLYFGKFSFVVDDDPSSKDGKERSAKKIGLWVGGITIVVWIILFLLTYVPAFHRGLVCIFY